VTNHLHPCPPSLRRVHVLRDSVFAATATIGFLPKPDAGTAKVVEVVELPEPALTNPENERKIIMQHHLLTTS